MTKEVIHNESCKLDYLCTSPQHTLLLPTLRGKTSVAYVSALSTAVSKATPGGHGPNILPKEARDHFKQS